MSIKKCQLEQLALQFVSVFLFSAISQGFSASPVYPKALETKNLLTKQASQITSEVTMPSVDERPLEIFLVDINIGDRNVASSATIRGISDDTQAIQLSSWQIPTSQLFPALKISVTVLEEGRLELSSPGFVTQVDAETLTADPDLGQVISVGDIERLLSVSVQFNATESLLVLEPQWANEQPSLPVVTAGLPAITSPRFNISSVRQQTTLSTRDNRQPNIQGNLSAVGSLSGGSWYVRAHQPDVADRTTWQLREAQYLRQTDAADYVAGTQPTFWPASGNQYWGLTTVQRFGFEPQTADRNGFSPVLRLRSSDVAQTIVGEADPGTLVRLALKPNNETIDEVLVDSSGRYRFESVSTADVRRWQLLLYPNGQLSADPEVRSPEFLSPLLGQLNKGTAALIASGGIRTGDTDSFFGNVDQATGGAAYRWGASDGLTVGLGAVYDESWQGLGELFYHPSGWPLQLAVSAISTGQYNANVFYKPSRQFDLSFSSDEQAQRFDANWRVGSRVRLSASGNTRDKAIRLGASGSLRQNRFYLSGSGYVDTRGDLSWRLNSRWEQFQLSHRRDERATSTVLNYALRQPLSSGHTLFLSYDTQRAERRSLLQTGWRYHSRARSHSGRDLWRFALGYGFGRSGNGLIASATTGVIPGLSMQLRYEGISLLSDSSTFRIELSPLFGLQPSLSLSDVRPEDIRNEGNLLIQPFFDANANGVREPDEPIHTEDLDSLLLLNHQRASRLQPEITQQGMLIKKEPGLYRLDLDPTGYLLNWRPSQTAYAVEITAGSQTVASIPLVQSYTISGTVTNSQGEAVAGAVVEVIAAENNSTLSFTDQDGIFFLERLDQGTYQLLVNGQPAQPQQVELDTDSPASQTLNLLIESNR